MISLVIYIASFVIVIGIVGSITIFFNNNIRNIRGSESVSSEYNKFNSYMLEYTKNGYEILKSSEEGEEETFVTFSNSKDGGVNTFVKLGDILYFNKIKLCEKVEEFELKQDVAENGKKVLKTKLNINGTVYTTDYVME